MSPLLRFVARYARRNVPQYAFGGLMLVATNYAVVRIPRLIGDALNVLESGGSDALAGSRDLALELLLWGAVVIVVRTLSRVLFFNPGRDVEYRLAVDLLGNLLRLQRPFFAHHKIGELVSVATNDATSVRLLVGFVGLQVCNVAVAIPMHLYQMLRTDVALTLWCIAPVAAGAVYMRWTVKRFYGMVRDSMQMLARLSDRVLETYAGIAAVRSHVADEEAVARFEERNSEYLALQLRISSIRAFSMPMLGLSGLVGTGIVLWVGGELVLDGQLGVGDLATFTALLVSLVAILMSLAWVLAAVSRGLVSVTRVDDLLHVEPDLPPVSQSLEVFAPPRLEVRDLTFTYPDGDRPVLQGISTIVEPGRTLGIFGHTGAGKTTLINVLARIHTPPAKTVFIADRDIAAVSLAELRDAMAVVPQDPFLFSTTLRENIRLAGERTTHDIDETARPKAGPDVAEDPRVQEVVDAACLVEDVAQLPAGLDTVVGERGVMLSGGQRQRAALARALYRGRPLLLLDDVLSAVDQGTEARLVEAIRRLRGATRNLAPTTVIVSHRTSVLEHADEILVLEDGRVAERGTHGELLTRDGLYAKTHREQAAGR